MSLTKVKAVSGNGSFENQYGTLQENPELSHHGKKLLYSFEYEMEDGIIIKANHKYPEGNFKVGDSVEYEVKKDDPTHGKSGRVTKPGAGNFGGSTTPSVPFKGGVGEDTRQLMIVRQSSLNRAVDILIHNSPEQAFEIDEIEVIELANRLTKWVMSPSKPLPEPLEFGYTSPIKEPVDNMVKAMTPDQPNPADPNSVSDDLPF